MSSGSEHSSQIASWQPFNTVPATEILDPQYEGVVPDGMRSAFKKELDVRYGAKWHEDGYWAAATPSAFDRIVFDEAKLHHDKIKWGCTSCGAKFGTRKDREEHDLTCAGKYNATPQETKLPTMAEEGEPRIELCVVPVSTKDWLLHLWWLPALAEEPKVKRIVIYSSMAYDTKLENGVQLMDSYRINTGRYLLHMVSDVLNQEAAKNMLLCCSGNPFEYLGPGYQPKELLEEAFQARSGALTTFRGAKMWCFTRPGHGVHPPIAGDLRSFEAVWDEIFRLLGRTYHPPKFLAHPGGNAFAIPIADIFQKNTDNGLKDLWNLFQKYLDRKNSHETHPCAKQILGLCWGSIFGDRGLYMPETPDPTGKIHIHSSYVPKCHLTMRPYKSTFYLEMPAIPSVGIVVATKKSNLKIDRRLSVHPNVREVTYVIFSEAPSVLNSEMVERAGDATMLAYLRYITFNYNHLPDLLLFIEHNDTMDLGAIYEQTNIVDAVLSPDYTHGDSKLFIPEGVFIEGLEFESWPEPSEAHYAQTMYECIAEVFGLEQKQRVTIGSLSAATFAVNSSQIIKHDKSCYLKLMDIIAERGFSPSMRALANRFWGVILDDAYFVRRNDNSTPNNLPEKTNNGRAVQPERAENPVATYRYNPAAGPSDLVAVYHNCY
ncbi:hypothetical protein FN846DRAFT_1005100 [Sphaerosporella brunnea]|uniref:Uncharacterized protein n=1 Tax=Sphaerosporella brunnea TaxID=1250544 RepID=A0A5J5EDE5_9PEZI|nr:hypothetical protein FN846DRAFT_1005100 [Sphaerosporella brunnea]